MLSSDSETPVFGPAFSCYKPPHHKVYGAVCMSQENRILVVKGRKSGKWSFPKGHKNGSETYLGCALRELREETGLDLKGMAPIGCHRFTKEGGEYYFFIMPEETTPEPRDLAEVEEAGWYSVDDLKRSKCNVDVSCFLRLMKQQRARSETPQEIVP